MLGSKATPPITSLQTFIKGGKLCLFFLEDVLCPYEKNVQTLCLKGWASLPRGHTGPSTSRKDPTDLLPQGALLQHSGVIGTDATSPWAQTSLPGHLDSVQFRCGSLERGTQRAWGKGRCRVHLRSIVPRRMSPGDCGKDFPQ